MKYSIIIADPPYGFQDNLTMADVKRSAKSNYETMSMKDICNLPVKDLAAENSIIALWCPSSMLDDGLEIMQSWGYKIKQSVVWVKSKKTINSYDPEQSVAMYMGRYFRNSHELALIGTCGKMASEVKNHSQKSVFFGHNLKHSQKPENLHRRLEVMFPQFENRLELFGRRNRIGWTVIGNEAPNCQGEDIRESIKRLSVQ